MNRNVLEKVFFHTVAITFLVCSTNRLLGQSADTLERMGLASKATLERGIMVPMRDGVRLCTTVVRPTSSVDKLPVILVRTDYSQETELLEDPIYKKFSANGYVVVLQNLRGTGWSEGTFHLTEGARNDGWDTLEWIVRQPWSNGKVGTIGNSGSGEQQLALASMNHPAHRAMIGISVGSAVGDIPGVSTQGGFYKGGVPDLEWEGIFRFWGHLNRPKLPPDISQEERAQLIDMYSPWPMPTPEMRKRSKERALLSRTQLPSRDILKRVGVPETEFEKIITISPADPFWQGDYLVHNGDHPRVPALYFESWYDYTSPNVLKFLEYLRDTPNQYVIVAPTAHGVMREAEEHTLVGDRDVGDARYDYDSLIMKWFDHWLKDEPNGVLDRPKVQAYLMGTNVWKTYPAWPILGTQKRQLYLESSGGANSRLGTGKLSDLKPGKGGADAFVSDPLYPVPYQGGTDDAPVAQDQGDVEMRQDVLVYSTDVFKEGAEVTGEIKGVLYVSSTAPDVDLALKIVDVYPDGRAFNISDTMLRMRYREGFDKVKFMKLGEVYRVELTGMMTSNYFGPAHRIRIEVSGSNSHFERNMQTGGKNYDETKPVVATIQIHHSADHASYIELPVVTP